MRPVIAVFPGASLMDISRRDDGGVEVRCPECKAYLLWFPTEADQEHVAFHHEDNCSVHARIREAGRRQAADIRRSARHN